MSELSTTERGIPAEVDLVQKLSSLETKIVTLQEQLAQLALGLLPSPSECIDLWR
jgi:hypothetical protein